MILVKEMHPALFEIRLVAERSRVKAAALGFDMRAHFARVRLTVWSEAQADQIADQHGVDGLRIDLIGCVQICLCIRDHVVISSCESVSVGNRWPWSLAQMRAARQTCLR